MKIERWTAETDARFNELRVRELAGSLSDTEQIELAQLIQVIEAEEANQLASAISRQQAEQTTMRSRLHLQQAENAELVVVLSQLEQLAADARRWLAEFEQRHAKIRQSYARLTVETLVHP
jgi:hypothetical protein